MPRRTPRIAVLGGGFAGLKTALLLERELRPLEAEVVLVDRSPFHTLRPKIPQAVGGRIPCSVNIPIERIIRGKHIRFIEQGIRAIDPEGPRVLLEGGELRADYLVVALGGAAEPPFPSLLPAWSFDQACNIRRRVEFLAKALLANRPVDASVVVIGGGFVGVELAAEIQHRLRRLGATRRGAGTILVEKEARLLSQLPAKASELARRRLESLGVRIITSRAVTEVRGNEVLLDGGEAVHGGTLVWAGGVRPAPPVAASPLADKTGRIPVLASLRSVDHPRVYAAGDCAYVAGIEARQFDPSAHRAGAQAEIVAANVLRDLRGEPPVEYRPEAPRYLLGLGPGYGLLVAPPLPIVSGRLPSLIKEAVMLRHVAQLGGIGLARRIFRATSGAALRSKAWDGEPLSEGNALG